MVAQSVKSFESINRRETEVSLDLWCALEAQYGLLIGGT